MTVLKVDEIESTGTNQNVKVTSKSSTGGLEIKGSGSDDGTLQLNCSTQSHGVKLKAPSNSAGQNYTLVLPDNQIAASKYLKVKSVTGSGATAIGQLEYGDAPAADLSNLNADNLTSGTVPAARFSIPPTAGAGLKFIQNANLGTSYNTNQTATQIDFTSLDADSTYKLIGKSIRFNNSSDILRMNWMDSSNNKYDYIGYTIFSNNYPYGSYVYKDTVNTSNSGYDIDMKARRFTSAGSGHYDYGFVADIYTGTGNKYTTNYVDFGSSPWMIASLWVTGSSGGQSESGSQIYASGDTYLNKERSISGIRLSPANSSSGNEFSFGTEFTLYKYIVS